MYDLLIFFLSGTCKLVSLKSSSPTPPGVDIRRATHVVPDSRRDVVLVRWRRTGFEICLELASKRKRLGVLRLGERIDRLIVHRTGSLISVPQATAFGFYRVGGGRILEVGLCQPFPFNGFVIAHRTWTYLPEPVEARRRIIQRARRGRPLRERVVQSKTECIPFRRRHSDCRRASLDWSKLEFNALGDVLIVHLFLFCFAKPDGFREGRCYRQVSHIKKQP